MAVNIKLMLAVPAQNLTKREIGGNLHIIENTYGVLAYVQLTWCSAVEMSRPFSRVGNSKSIIYAENSAETVDSASSR